MARRRGWDDESARDTMLLLTEEIGELARAVRKHEGLKRDHAYDTDIAEELADVQLYLLHLASIQKIDLGDAVTAKETHNEKRFRTRPSAKPKSS
jgi:NTP pyrophosphatase (non-canonical NTP hydrolase)